MPATLITETDPVTIDSLVCLIYGPPGSGKTSLAQSAERPLTLDFDRGGHRSAFRKSIMRFDAWADVQDAKDEIAKAKTIVVDTVGRMLDLLAADIIRANAKHGTFGGGLSLQGYGALKARFAQWISQLRVLNKDIILIAHEKEEKDGDSRLLRPDITGGSYSEVMKYADMVGFLAYRGGARVLDFNPTDAYIGKNAAGFAAQQVPDLNASPFFFAGVLAAAKNQIGRTAAMSAEIAKAVADWSGRLADDPTVDELNGMLPELAALGKSAKAQVWSLIVAHAEAAGCHFDKASKTFKANESGGAA